MPELTFYHDTVSNQLGKGELTINTGANNIAWGYNLNSVTYPTYGGEVVQILSVYIDDLVIDGETRSYEKMEEIYRWFIAYFQIATQGDSRNVAAQQKGGPAEGGDTYHYNQSPVYVNYPHRGWSFTIRPIALPGIAWGREVVVPTYSLKAAVIEADPQMTSLTIEGAEAGLEQIHAGIGYQDQNPFSDPYPNKDFHSFDPSLSQADMDKIADWFNNLIPAYQKSDFSDLTEDLSKPAFLNPSRKGTVHTSEEQTAPVQGSG